MNNPAITIPLQGKALIEASAGTGKTWTLTGILLRLIVEAGYETRDIVATTFTRAAAAEMQRRVQARLEDYRLLMVDLITCYQEDESFFAKDGLNERINAQIEQWAADSEDGKRQQRSADPINRHLIHHTLTQSDDAIDGIIRAYRRTTLALTDIDKLFIGTLDSLCQRWLRELALESGIDQININQNSDAVTNLAHDYLRAYQQQRARDNLELFIRYCAAKPPTLTDHTDAANSALNFGNAPFVSVELPNPDPTLLTQAQAAINALGEEQIQACLQHLIAAADGKKLDGKKALKKKHLLLPNLVHNIRHGQALNKDEQALGAAIIEAAEPDSSQFNKGANEDYRAQLNADPVLSALHPYLEADKAIGEAIERIRAHSATTNAEHVREQLPQTLRHSRETTYGELLATLNRTLASEKDARLAHYLAHRYPVILIDEAQDLNAEQTRLIEQVYFRSDSHADGKHFLLLVGDPKQAIYRFRGSDVDNYRHLRSLITNHYNLDTNFRSAHNLVSALNYSYPTEQPNLLGTDITYHPMQSNATADSPRPIRLRHGGNIPDPLIWFDVDSAGEEPKHILELIQNLTSKNSAFVCHDPDLGGARPIRCSDIMVLARGNSILDDIEHILNQQHIATERQADKNLFAQPIAAELYTLMLAILDPQHSGKTRRLLAGRLYNLDKNDLDNFESTDSAWRIGNYRADLAHAAQDWQQYGLLSALQRLLQIPNHRGHSVWETLAAQPKPDCYRDLLDLRALQQVITEHSRHRRPPQFIDWWQRQLNDPPQAEWAQCLPLPGSDAVRLMTIHKSKGLQAPIVILAGLGSGSFSGNSSKLGVQAYHDNGELKLAIAPQNDTISEQIKQENNAENRRLIYVALTRAADLLFVAKRTSRFVDAAAMLAKPDAAHSLHLSHDSLMQHLNDDSPIQWRAISESTPQKNGLEPLAQPNSSGWRKTSFSALARTTLSSADDLAVHSSLDLELIHESDTNPEKETTDIAPCFTFPRGTQAGSFLHEALEKIHANNSRHWDIFLTQLWQKHHLTATHSEPDLVALKSWMQNIVHSPLACGLPLVELPIADQQRELGFSIALNSNKSFPVGDINQLFKTWGKPLILGKHTSLYRYLRGEIDLVYRHNGRYYIVDYKSNHLGNHHQDYHRDAMNRTMDEHHYWLQAALYQVALHRLLQARLPGYQPEQHLGSVEYYFIRAALPDDAETGHLHIDIPTQLILDLDNILHPDLSKKSI
ncbi:UvrD-helicase domain-containing protein [Cardiobacteriaceae bacterium TAE3-ERU3]|nr:UvrD-helicase domain-containing protein [Cardiobacteriaceae bacterium TAE3-ERU3]